MKRLYILPVLALLTLLSGCEAVGTIFKGGMWFGIIIVVAVVLIILFFVNRNKK